MPKKNPPFRPGVNRQRKTGKKRNRKKQKARRGGEGSAFPLSKLQEKTAKKVPRWERQDFPHEEKQAINIEEKLKPWWATSTTQNTIKVQTRKKKKNYQGTNNRGMQ